MGGPPRLKIPRRQHRQNASPSIFGPKWLPKRLLNDLLSSTTTFLLSNPFWTRNLLIFDPLEPSKSSICIERVVIFAISTFSVRVLSFLLLGSLLASILVPFQTSWGSLGAVLGASWGLPGGFLGVSWGFLVESWAREPPKGLLRGLRGPPGESPGASGKPPEGLLGVSWNPPKDLLDASCGPPAS